MSTSSMKLFAVLLLAGVSSVAIQAKVIPARVFSDHMVLQREMPVPIWGKADPGEKVTVEFAGQKCEGIAGKDGKWRIDLAPLKTAGEGSIMRISGKDNAVEVKDVLVGEVWLCGGQSNMYQPMWGNRANYRQYNGKELAKTANFPKIRFVQMPRVSSFTPAPELITDYSWKAIAPDTVEPTSAVAFFFSRELFTKLNIPIGLIQSSWGGSRIEPWIPLEGYQAVPQGKELGYGVEARIPGSAANKKITAKLIKDISSWQKRVETAIAAGKLPPQPPEYPLEFQKVGPRVNTTPASLYNSMILPFVPYAMRGAIWYQGCSNLSNGYDYIWKLDALHKGWSAVFENSNFKLYIVQLAPYVYGDKKVTRIKPAAGQPRHRAEMLPTLQYSQQLYADRTPNAALVVTTDVGNFDDIHPGDKTKVGLRLANLALKYDYGMKNIKAESPRVVSRRIDGGKVIISFKNVEKWVCKDGKSPVQFEAVGADGKCYPATAEIKGTDIVVSCSRVKKPYKINYGWSHFFEAELFNEAGLPVGPFTLDIVTAKERVEKHKKQGKLIYEYNLLADSDKILQQDNSKNAGKFSRIKYIMFLTDQNGEDTFVAASVDAFTKDAAKIGIPLKQKFIFNQNVKKLRYDSNVLSLGGRSSATAVVEISPYNYSFQRSKKLRGASGKKFDYDDSFVDFGSYGCFQLHDYSRKKTVFAFNNFNRKDVRDIGIGNNPDDAGHPDWTFSKNGRRYKAAKLYITVE